MSSSKTLGEFALDYAQRGWHVLPCNPATKHPYVGCDKDAAGRDIPKTGGLYKATTKVDQIKAWWQLWAHAMIGIRMGEPSGVWALDPDIPDELGAPDGRANWSNLVAKHGGCPSTHTSDAAGRFTFAFQMARRSAGQQQRGPAKGARHQRARQRRLCDSAPISPRRRQGV